jgi:mono/diheme cytochrome c family protein
MAEKKGVGHAYNVDFLNVVFAASSVFLFLSVIWMVWDDFDREWKNTQREFVELEMAITEANRAKAAKAVDQNRIKQLQAQKAAAEKNVAANQAKVDELEDKMAEVESRLYRENQEYQFAKANLDTARYDFEADRIAGRAGADEEAAIKEQDARVRELNLVVEKTTAEANALRAELGKFTGEVVDIQKQIDELNTESSRLAKRLEVLAPSFLKDYFRNAPLLDFMAPTIKVNQLLLPNVVDDVNFTRVAKMDRCTTCHLAIDRPGYEKYPQPFRTHPNLPAYVSSASPHPMDQVGCTVCHEGLGQSVSFSEAFHTPPDDKKKHEWEEKYHWEEPHLWDYPMLQTNMTEASCAKCHRQDVFLPNAEKLNVAYATYERAGCYACHKTRGFEGLRKPGPILTKIQSKLTPEWVKTWIRNPHAVKRSTWMPRVWYNSNNSAPEDAIRNETEIDAVVAYLFARSDTHDVAVRNPPRGDAKRGQQLVESVGCMGCHVLEETRADAGPRRTFGQPLQGIGSKTTYEWIYDWVRDPKHYNAGTYMPDLRLTDAEVADVATFISGLKGTGGDAAKATSNEKAVDDLLLEYLNSVLPLAESQAQLARWSPQQRQLELGQRAIGRYGCYSCHEIGGFENTQPIGTELSEAGSKLVSRLDFAFIEDISHYDKTAWYRTKLHDPRIFDKGRVLRPLDKLRMPNFDLSEVENARLVTAIMSFQRDIQPAQAMPVKSARRDFLAQGRNLVSRRNCVGCHIIEGVGGDYLTLLKDPSTGPPNLTPVGGRVQKDWLYAFIRGPIAVRPWLDVRMPTFNFDDPHLNVAISYFGAISNDLVPFRTQQVSVSNTTDVGKQLFELAQCQKCHVLGAIPRDQPTANLAPDLRMVPDRLQHDWILDWLRAPATILPGTRMPAFWPDYPKSPFTQLNGDAAAQIRAIRDYMLTFRGGPSPRPGAMRSAN